MKTFVLSLGGSLIAPGGVVDYQFLRKFRTFILKRVEMGDRFVIVTGGGGVARAYQSAAKKVIDLTRDDLDWLGIHATRINAHLLRTLLRDVAMPVIVKDPSRLKASKKYRVIVASGWKPGWSTDYVATRIAKRLKAETVINLSNIDYVYTADPRVDKTATKIKEISWEDFRKIVGSEWDPGLSAPFDPVASRLAHNSKIPVYIANGKKIANLGKILDGEKFVGTVIK